MDPSRQYNGRVYDPGTGFHDYGARMYWPEIGRFISVDAAGPNLGSPATFNRYSYVLNNPYKYVDPTGHFAMLPPNAMDGMPPGPFQWAMAQLVEAATYATQYYAKNSTDESSPGWQRALNFVAGSAASLMTEANADTTMMVLSVGAMKVTGGGPRPLAEQAAELVPQNGGRSRVTLNSPSQRMEVDLTGKAHGDVPTPHTKVSLRNMQAPESQQPAYNTKKAATVPATQQDIRTVRRYLERQDN